MMKLHSIAFTGHREMRNEDLRAIDLGLARLHDESLHSPMTFHSGGAKGFDTRAFFFTGMWMNNDSRLHIPFDYQLVDLVKELRATKEVVLKYGKLCSQCGPSMLPPKSNPWFYQKRNEHMVDLADEVICYWNGEPRGGTWNTIKYARKVGKPVRDIREI